MTKELHDFLKTDLLERYLIGQTNAHENEEVEFFLEKYPEAQTAYNKLQNNLELITAVNAKTPSNIDLLDAIFEAIDDAPVHQLKPTRKKTYFKYAIAASVATLFFASTSYFLYDYSKRLSNENQTIVEEVFDLRMDMELNKSLTADLREQFLHMNSPETKKYIFESTNRIKNLKTVAYINPSKRTSMVDVAALPKLPKGKDYQIWADMQGKMVSLGILSKEEAKRRLQIIPYFENASGLTITVEPKGGSTIASINEVAELKLVN